MNGIFVAIRVMNWTFASSGRLAMCTTALATRSASIIGSARVLPSGCRAPDASIRARSVAALPMSIWPQAMSYARPSRDVAFVRPVIACLVAVYGAENGRGECAEIEPLLMIRPPRGSWSLITRNAAWVHRNAAVRFTPTTDCQSANDTSSSGTGGRPRPALLNSTSTRPKWLCACSKSRRTSAGLLTSAATASIRDPSAAPSRTVCSSGPGRRPAIATAYPARPRASADARPMPVPPPVTNATLPVIAQESSTPGPRRRPDELGAGLLHGELGGGVGLQALVRDRHAAADRAAVGALVQPPQRPVDRVQPVPKALRDRVVHALCGQRHRGIGVADPLLVLGLPVGLRVRLGALQRAQQLGALVLQQGPGPVFVHVRILDHRAPPAPALPPQGRARPCDDGRVAADRLSLRTTFDSAADLYQQSRPEYPEALYDDLAEVTGIRPGDRLLEIGCATGKATIPLARRGFRITCVEIGAALAAAARQNLAGLHGVQVIEGSFETWPPPAEGGFDVVFAATAWHWVDPAVKYRRAWEVLRPGGHLAVWDATHVFPAGGDPFFSEIQDVYDEIGEGLPPDAPRPRPGELPDSAAEIE